MHAPTACRRMVSGTISLPLSGFFSPFPHGTSALSVSQEYLALPDGPGGFAQNSTCSALLRILLDPNWLHVRGCHPLWLFFPEHSIHRMSITSQSYNPKIALLQPWFGLFPGRSPLLGESLLFSLPTGTKMFQFPAFASYVRRITGWTGWVVPFGNLRINGHLHLPGAYRSLSRPSSPL